MRYLFIIISILFFAPVSFSQDWENFTRQNSPLVSDQVRSICIDKYGVKWFGTDSGLTRYDGNHWQNYSCDDKLLGNPINEMVFEESEFGDELWLATENGAFVIRIMVDSISIAESFTTDNSGLVSNTVFSTAIDTGHINWFGTDSGVSIFNRERWRSFTTNDYLLNNFILCIASANDGWNYLGTKGKGVNRLRRDDFDVVTSASPYDTQWSGLASDSVYSAFIDSDGTKWFGTNAGLSRHEGEETKENWIRYTTNDGLAHNFVQTIARDSAGNMWIGTLDGVSRFDGTEWESFDTSNGLGSNVVFDIAVDTDGSIWFGTDAGVSNFIDNTLPVETTEQAEAIPNCNLKIYPNPFNIHTTILLSIQKDDYISVTIYNLLGQPIRQLLHKNLRMGSHSITWNGKDEKGWDVSNGVYFLRIEGEDFSINQKVVVVK
jgi:ligand-binding sensor domain-containing protein